MGKAVKSFFGGINSGTILQQDTGVTVNIKMAFGMAATDPANRYMSWELQELWLRQYAILAGVSCTQLPNLQFCNPLLLTTRDHVIMCGVGCCYIELWLALY